MYIYIYTHTHTHTHIYIYIYIYTYVYSTVLCKFLAYISIPVYLSLNSAVCVTNFENLVVGVV